MAVGGKYTGMENERKEKRARCEEGKMQGV